MSPSQNLPLSHYDAVGVLVADDGATETAGIKITVYGESFAQRALAPTILVGDQLATRVEVAPDQRSIRGLLAETPPDGARSACATDRARRASCASASAASASARVRARACRLDARAETRTRRPPATPVGAAACRPSRRSPHR